MGNTFGCMLITTNVSRRIKYITNAINSVDNCGVEFDKKVLSIDLFEGEENLSFFDRFEGWEIVYGSPTGMINNQARGLLKIDTDYILYCEDKVIIEKIPNRELLDAILERFKYICFNMHICENFCNPHPQIIEYINNANNYIFIENELFLIKNLNFADNYFLNFPVCITTTELFKKLHSIAITKYPDLATELSMTKVWMEEFSHTGDVGIYTQSNTLERLPINLMDLFYQSNIKYWNNCPKLRIESIKQCSSRMSTEYLRRLNILEEYEIKLKG